MVQCEMCGAETSSPSTIKVEGAELDVCDGCTDFGTEVRTQETSTTSTKYSTTSSSGQSSGTSSGSGRSSGTGRSGGGRRPGSDMFDDVEELAADYDGRIRRARESAGLSQDDLAKKLNEKASLISKLEQGSTLPSDTVQKKLERELDISLTSTGGTEETEWESDSSSGSYTLGDVVKRKD